MQELLEDRQHLELALGVFLSVCRTLQVDDPSDPLSKAIAHTVILIACEGERNPKQLYQRTLDWFLRDRALLASKDVVEASADPNRTYH